MSGSMACARELTLFTQLYHNIPPRTPKLSSNYARSHISDRASVSSFEFHVMRRVFRFARDPFHLVSRSCGYGTVGVGGGEVCRVGERTWRWRWVRAAGWRGGSQMTLQASRPTLRTPNHISQT